eukprot:GHRQ01036206.1.p1 GENE.GHRQ01036206.1~~GHRQ01036206.1.p1  ORF type:complete len:122 (-),score=5.22 GHRQ01036206.1:17-382(-)
MNQMCASPLSTLQLVTTALLLLVPTSVCCSCCFAQSVTARSSNVPAAFHADAFVPCCSPACCSWATSSSDSFRRCFKKMFPGQQEKLHTLAPLGAAVGERSVKTEGRILSLSSRRSAGFRR